MSRDSRGGGRDGSSISLTPSVSITTRILPLRGSSRATRSLSAILGKYIFHPPRLTAKTGAIRRMWACGRAITLDSASPADCGGVVPSRRRA